MIDNKKLQIYVVEGEAQRITPEIWHRLEKYFGIEVYKIKLDELIDIANKKVHLIIFDNVSSKQISYSTIDKIQQNNQSLYTGIVTEQTDMKNLTRVYDNHIDYVFTSGYDDDYFVAKFKTILKRTSPKYMIDVSIEYKDITVDRLMNEIKINNVIVDTTRKEYQLIKKLVKNHDKFLTKAELFKQIWGYDEDTSRVLDQYLHRIKKILAPSEAKIIVDRENGIKLF